VAQRENQRPNVTDPSAEEEETDAGEREVGYAAEAHNRPGRGEHRVEQHPDRELGRPQILQ